jgi:hypothetical protein
VIDVPVVVTLHLEVEDLGLGGAGGGHEVGVEQREDAVADAGELGLDLGAVGADGGGVGLVAAALLLLLDGGDDPPRRPARSDDVLVGDGEQVALLDGELLPAADATGGLRHALHELHHLLVPLRLLGQLGHVHALLPGGLRRRHGGGGVGRSPPAGGESAGEEATGFARSSGSSSCGVRRVCAEVGAG